MKVNILMETIPNEEDERLAEMLDKPLEVELSFKEMEFDVKRLDAFMIDEDDKLIHFFFNGVKLIAEASEHTVTFFTNEINSR